MAIAFVNSATGSASAATVATGAFVATGGNAIFVGVSAAVKQATGISDTAGNTYVKALSDSSQTGANVSIWYALNVTGNAANVVTAGFGGTGGDCNISIHQVSGIAASSALDQIKSSSNNTGTAVTTGASPATVKSNEYVFAVAAANATQTWTVGAGYSNLVTNVSGTRTHAVEGKTVSATASQTATFTSSASGLWGCALATFADTSVALTISISDSATTSEYVDIINDNARDTNVNDTSVTTENISQYLDAFFVNVSTGSSISDTNNSFLATAFISTADSLTTAENISFLDTAIDAVSDSSTIAVNLNLTLVDNVTTSNTATLAENLAFLVNPLLLSINDALTMAENAQVLVPTLLANVSDSLAITENYSVFVRDINTLIASASDNLSLSENLSLLIPSLYIVVNDTTATSESQNFIVSYNIAVTDSLSTSENVVFLDEDVDLISDNLATTESLTLLIPELYVAIANSLTTTENISFTEPETIVISDVAATTESVSLTASPGLKVSDAITTTINSIVQYYIDIDPQDISPITESLAVAIAEPTTKTPTVADNLSVGENLSLLIPTLTIKVSDTLVTSFLVSVVGKTAFINVSDTISTLDIASAGSIEIKTSNSIAHTEAISIHIQAHIQKTYLYKMSRNNKFLGILQNVTSEFSYAQDINTGGSQCNITVALSADTQDQAVTPLQDELGNTLTDEAGNPLLIERQPDIIGNDNDNILIRNDNDIQIYEFSDYWPNGKLMFSGYISTVQAMFGADDGDIINLTALSDGSEVNEYLIESGTNNDQTQLFQNASDTLVGPNPKSGAFNYDGQSVTIGGGVTNVSGIVVKLQGSGANQIVTMLFYDGPNGNLLASVNQTLTSAAISDYTFTFTSTIPVTAGNKYFFAVTTDALDGINIFYQNNDIYSGGDMYNNNYSGASGGSFTITPVGSIINNSDLYFKTLTTTNATEAAYTNFDPTDILKDIMLNYNNKGGRIMLDPNVSETGLGANYTFNVNSVAEGITKVQELSPNGWYWYIDVATKVLYFQPTATTAQYKFIRGRHLNSLQLKSTIDNLKNVVYFSGGDPGGGNVYVKYTNTASLAANNNRVGMDRISDSNVLDTTTGLVLAKDDSNEHMSEEYQTQISIIDTTMDITLPHVGDTIGFEGYGSFVDKLVLQITRITYTPEVLTITVGTLPRRVHKDIQKLKDQLIALQVQNNTSSPTLF